MTEARLLFYYRQGCHLCEEMESLLEEHGAGSAFVLEKLDIDQHAELKAKYNADVPVVMYKNELLFRHFFDETRFLQALARNAG